MRMDALKQIHIFCRNVNVRPTSGGYMKYMPLFPQYPSRRAVMSLGIDLPATGFYRVFADGPLVLYM